MKTYGCEFTDEQIARIDEVENAAYDFALVLTELNRDPEGIGGEDCLPWSMEFIGEIADAAAEILTRCGCKVRYPFHTTDGEGKDIICDYIEDI